MAYEPSGPLSEVAGYWQTLIAGVLAVLAGAGTIWATIKSANREIGAAQAQIALTRRIEKRRVAAEAYAFYAMLEASSASILEDVSSARLRVEKWSGNSPVLPIDAFVAISEIRKPAFNELPGACLRFGGLHTRLFLDLEHGVDEIAARASEGELIAAATSDPTELAVERQPRRARALQVLERIALQAMALRDAAAQEMQRCNEVLADSQTELGI